MKIFVVALISLILISGCITTPIESPFCGNGICETPDENFDNCPISDGGDCAELSEKKTCEELNGFICNENEICDESFLEAADTTDCCSATCDELPSGTKTLKVALANPHERNFENAVEITRNVIIEKNPDLIILHEFAFSVDPDTVNYIIVNEGKISQGDNLELFESVNQIVELAGDFETNILLTVKTAPGNGITSLLINKEGQIDYVYPKFGKAIKGIIYSKDDEEFSFFTGICTSYDNPLWHGEENFNADLFLNPGWGGGAPFIISVMEYYQYGEISDETFDFYFPELLERYDINSKADLTSRIEERSPPFDWIATIRNRFESKDALNNNGFILVSDEVISPGIIGQRKGNKPTNVEFGGSIDYVYAELEFPN